MQVKRGVMVRFLPACAKRRLIIMVQYQYQPIPPATIQQMQKYQMFSRDALSIISLHYRPSSRELFALRNIKNYASSRLAKQISDNQLVDVVPTSFPEAIQYEMHVFHRDGCAHEAEQPPVEEALGIYLNFLHVLVQVKDMLFEGVFDTQRVSLQMLKTTKVDLPQLLLFHEADQRPESETLVFYVVKQHSSNHIHSLDIPRLQIIDGISHKNIPKHLSKVQVVGIGGALWVCPCQILLYLCQVLSGRRFSQQVLKDPVVQAPTPLHPGLAPRAYHPTQASLFAQPFTKPPAEVCQFIPIEQGFNGTVLNALRVFE